ncbi:hypothetical protein ACFXKY_33120 [Streptomyces canus]|uniref:hypothetical protein n=1 Tax=Streptomyces canus TaxID=58343 RepID=UPI0036BADC01
MTGMTGKTGTEPDRFHRAGRPRRKLMLTALAIGTLLAVPALSAATPADSAPAAHTATTPAAQRTPSTPRPTVVLVHGAFADSSSWDAVT